MDPAKIKQLIEAHLQNTVALVEGDDGQHFKAIVVCPLFAGQSRIKQQQMVYEPLNDLIKNGTIHAISIKTFTPHEWQVNNLK